MIIQNALSVLRVKITVIEISKSQEHDNIACIYTDITSSVKLYYTYKRSPVSVGYLTTNSLVYDILITQDKFAFLISKLCSVVYDGRGN